MSLQNKLTTERNERAVLDLAQRPGNDICADCKVRHPRWASHNLGIFICVNCASIHRKIGTHITKVKSLTMDSWTKDQVEIMRSMGNIKSNAIFNPNEIRYPPPPNLEDTERDSELEQYIRSKYEYRRFMDKSALVASKLGPSRSMSSVTSRTSPSSLESNTASSSIAKSSPLSTTSTRPTTTPSRPTTSQSAVPENRSLAQARSVSHPTLTNPPSQSQPQGVWADLVSLQPSSTAPSLPLQYQQTVSSSNAPFSTGNNGYATGMTTNFGTNSYQGQQFANPYAQQQQPQSVFSSSMSTPFTGSMQFATAEQPQYSYVQQQNYGQQPFANQLQTQSPIPAPSQAPFFQPQPQASFQMQVPQGNGFLTPSPGLQYVSTPAGQVQFMSHSPQPQIQLYPTPSPQPISMMSGQQMMGGAAPTQYMQSNSIYQGQVMGGAPQQMMSQGNFGGPGGGGYTNQMFGQSAGYQGQQWGAM